MNKYIIYSEGGNTHSMMIPKGYTEDEVKSHISKNGGSIVGGYAIVGSSEEDAVNRFLQASKLREEAKQIGSPENVQRVQEAVQADEILKQENAYRERTRREAEAYHNQESGKTGAMALLKQMGRSVPKLATSTYEAVVNPDPELGRAQTFADRYMSPYESDLAQQTIGDPTLVPSMLIPSVGETKLASLAGKVIPSVLKGGKAERLLVKPAQELTRKVADNVVQSAVVEAPNALEGRGDVRNIATGTLVGSGIGSGLELAGKGAISAGRKIIQSTVKPKVGSKFNVDELMNATNPDGSKVVGAFSGADKVSENIYKSLGEWSEKQAKAIPDASVDMLPKIGELKDEYYQKLSDGKIDTEDYKKAVKVLDQEEARFAVKGLTANEGGFVEINAPMQNVHNAKKDVGAKGKFDMKDPSKLEPIQREAYRDAYGAYSDVLGGLDGNSEYKQATSAMVPLMNAKKDIENARERIDRNNVIPLTSAMFGAGGFAGGDLKTAIAMGAFPWLLQGMRTGTGAYRMGEVFPQLSQYATPLGIRASNNGTSEDQNTMSPMSVLSNK